MLVKSIRMELFVSLLHIDFKKVVDNEYFDRIRHILQHSKERYLALYKFKIKSYNDTSETKADDEVKTEEKYK